MAKNIKAEGQLGTEQYEVKKFVDLIRPFIKKIDSKLDIETQVNLWYTNYCRRLNQQEAKQRQYAVDILVKEGEIPRVVIECKIKEYNTHSIIDYSEKAGCHKTVFPHLRYGFLVLNSSEGELKRRYYEHAHNFDFEEIFPDKWARNKMSSFANRIVDEAGISRVKEKIFFDRFERI